MDRNVLKQAAKHHAYDNYDRSYRDRQEGFEACGEWFIQQPLVDRLTDEEKESIIKAYTEAKQCCQTMDGGSVFEQIFGKENLSSVMESLQNKTDEIIPDAEVYLGDMVKIRHSGKVGKLIGINHFSRKEHPFEVVTEDGNHIFCKPEDVKLEARKPQKFQIGDWVRFLGNDHTVGKVIAYDMKMDHYQVLDLDGYNNTCCGAGLLELIQKPMYSVGEPVKVIKSVDHLSKLSTVVKIIWSEKMKTFCYQLENIFGTFLEDCIEHDTTEDEVNSEKLKLDEILRNHIGETFYCSLAGQYVKVVEILDAEARDAIVVEQNDGERISLNSDGSFFEGGDMQLFPTKENRDWIKWKNEYCKFVITLNVFQSADCNLVKPGCHLMVRDAQEMEVISHEIADLMSKLAERHNLKMN